MALGLVSMKLLDPAGRHRNYTKKKGSKRRTMPQKNHFVFLKGLFSEQFLKECGEHFNNLNTLFHYKVHFVQGKVSLDLKGSGLQYI